MKDNKGFYFFFKFHFIFQTVHMHSAPDLILLNKQHRQFLDNSETFKDFYLIFLRQTVILNKLHRQFLGNS